MAYQRRVLDLVLDEVFGHFAAIGGRPQGRLATEPEGAIGLSHGQLVVDIVPVARRHGWGRRGSSPQLVGLQAR